jgi:hypothetical protein
LEERPREVVLAQSAVKPRVDDFGITEEDLRRAPCLFVAGHRPFVIAVAYLVVAGFLFALLLNVGGSSTGAIFFTVISLAAGSVVLLPVLMVIVCASERVEERWLCGRFPKLGACLAYRSAVADHERREREAFTADRTARMWWSGAAPEVFIEASKSALLHEGSYEVRSVDRESTGFDFEVGPMDGRILIRCEPGTEPAPAAVGRELAAAVADRGAAKAFIVAAAGASPALADYIVGRPIVLIAPWELQERTRNSDFGIRLLSPPP